MIPSREPTLSQLRNRGLSVIELIYNTDVCFVYKAKNASRLEPVALKFLLFSVAGNSTEAIQREIENQMACQKHPNIVQLYDHFWFYLNAQTWVVCLEMELLSGDVYKDIQNRFKNRYPYEEATLLLFITALIDALAFAQDLNYAHRDVKPQNIFVLSRDAWKLGDFGSSKQLGIDPREMTITGTPYYLSPALREGIKGRSRYVVHNPFKSDVYSLGLTLLHMVRLEPINPFGDLKATVESAIPVLGCSQFMKQFIWWMLTYVEADRPDFKLIRAYTRNMYSASKPIVVTECEHVKDCVRPEDTFEFPCKHKACLPCANRRVQLRIVTVQVECPVCNVAFEYIVAQPQPSEPANTPIDPQPRADTKPTSAPLDSNQILTSTKRIRVFSGIELESNCTVCGDREDCVHCLLEKPARSPEYFFLALRQLTTNGEPV